MCYGSAKPIFMSDAPGFLQRQRARAAKHLVSEHAGGVIRLANLEVLMAFRKKKGEQTGNYGNYLWVRVELVGLDQGQGPQAIQIVIQSNDQDHLQTIQRCVDTHSPQPYLFMMVIVCTDMI